MSRTALWIGRLAMVVAVIALLVVIISGPGYRYGWWELRTALFTLFRFATYAGLGAAALGLVAIVVGVARKAPGAAWGLFAVVLGVAAAAVPLGIRDKAGKVPAIHDITTDVRDPPSFVAIAPLRADAPNPVAYDPEATTLQREAYPDIGTIRVRESSDQVMTAASGVATDMGWEIVEIDAEAGRLEATATTPWFGFKDDVVIRVRSQPSVTQVDVRSKSRVGQSDLGVNAERIREFRHRLLDRLTASR